MVRYQFIDLLQQNIFDDVTQYGSKCQMCLPLNVAQKCFAIFAETKSEVGEAFAM